jgi:type I restriction enzyme S subunit
MVTFPKDWKTDSLGKIGTFIKGAPLSKSAISDSGTPLVLYGELYTTYTEVAYKIYRHTQKMVDSQYYSQIGDVIIPTSGETAEDIATACCIMVPGTIMAGDLNIYRARDFDGRFISYVLNHVVNKQISEIAQGISIIHINAKELKKIEINYPEKDEQEKIADTLDLFDEYISDLNALIEKKKGIRDGALEDLICQKTRVDGFESEWTKVSFDQVIIPKARIGWQGLKKHEYLRMGYSYLIGGTDFNNGTISFDNISYVTKERFDMDTNIQVGANDVLVTKDGTIGKVAIVPELNKPATLNSGVFVFRTNGKLSPKFLFRVLTSSVFKEFIETLSAGSTIKHLYQKDLKNFEFVMPTDLKEQEAIAEILTAMDQEIEYLEIERDKMAQIREGALDDLLTGRVRIAE